METRPLFPLNTVLFPGVRLPIRIFEPRYHEMLDGLLAEADATFVVSMTGDSEADARAAPAPIACLARVLQASPPGPVRYVLAEGLSRARIDAVHHDRAFAEAAITRLVDEEGPGAEAAARELGATLESHLDALGLAARDLPCAPVPLSYAVASALPLDLEHRQALLEAPHAAARLHLETRAVRDWARAVRLAPLAAGARYN